MTTTDTTIETRHDRRITVDHYDDKTVLEIVNTITGRVLGAGLTPGEARQIAAALTGQGGQWARDDLPAAGRIMHESWKRERYGVEIALSAVVAHLNAYYPKPQPYDQGGVRGADSLLYRAERERDAAVARADNLDKQLAKVMSDYQDVEDERDEWKARAEKAEQLIPAYAMLDIWMALGRDSLHFDDWYDKHGYADAWAELTAAVREARTAPAVTCAHRNAVADHLWNAMVGSAKSVVRDVVAQAFAAAGIEVAVEAEQAVVDPIEPEGDVIVRDASGHMWWVTDDGWTNGSSRLDHDWSDVPKPIRSVYRVEQEESSDE